MAMDINKASAQDLENTLQLDGTRARYLEEYRNRIGEFTSWEQIRAVPSFDDGMIKNLKDAGLTLGSDTWSDKGSRSPETDEDSRSGAEERGAPKHTSARSQS